MSSKFTQLLKNRRRTARNIGSQIRLSRQHGPSTTVRPSTVMPSNVTPTTVRPTTVMRRPNKYFTPQQIQGHINKLNRLMKPPQEKDVSELNEVNMYQSRFTPEQITRRKKKER